MSVTAETLITNFTAGELSPHLWARLDLENFFNGAASIENYIVQPFGGIIHRPGTRFVAEVKDSSKYTRLLPFQFSTTQSYIIEAGDTYFRFYRDEGRVESGGSPVEVTGTPYTEADLPDLKYAQSADVLYLAHPNYVARTLTRTSDTAWTLDLFDPQDGPYMDINVTTTTLNLSGTTGTVTVTASSVTGINNDTGFQNTDVGRQIRWKDPAGNYTWLQIASVTDTTHVNATIRGADASATGATTDWQLGAWCSTTGWPHTVTFHKGRLWFGGNDTFPQTLWSSYANNFDDFAPSDPDLTVTAAHAMTIVLNTDTVNAIKWMKSTRGGLVIGTANSEVLITEATSTAALGAGNIEAQTQTNYGSDSYFEPILIGNSLLFVQRGAQVLNEMIYSFEADGYVARDITLLAEHLGRSTLNELAYTQNPLKIVWTANGDGTLLGLTFEKDQKVLGWHHHILGGQYNGGQTQIDSLAHIVEPTKDQLWVIALRTINGVTKRYIEFIEDYFDETTMDLEDAFFVDSGLSGTSATPTATWSGLDHLEGETVTVLADGAVRPPVTVSGGQIVLSNTASTVHVGLYKSAKLITLPYDAYGGGRTTFGKRKRYGQVWIKLYSTLGLKVAAFGETNDVVPFGGRQQMNNPPALFTGIKKVPPAGSHTEALQLVIEQPQPLPSTIQAIGITLEYSDAAGL